MSRAGYFENSHLTFQVLQQFLYFFPDEEQRSVSALPLFTLLIIKIR